MSNARVVRVYDNGYRLGILCKEGTKYDYAVVMECPIDSHKLPNDDETAYEIVTHIDVDRAICQFLSAGVSLGITERAKALLEGAK